MTTGLLNEFPERATVVVIRLRSLGDTVLTTPALALLKQARPDLRVVVVVEPPFDALLEGNPDVSRILTIPRAAGGIEKWRLLGQIRREKPHLCLNLHGGSTSAWLTALSGARFRAGFAHYRNRIAYNLRIPRAQDVLGRTTNDPVHTAEHLASAMFYLGVPHGPIPRARLHRSPGSNPVEGQRPYGVFHVSAAYFTKQWPASRFVEIADSLHQRGIEPVILTGPGEEGLGNQFPNRTHFAGKPLTEVQALIAGATLFVGNDSGPAHIAAAFGIPTVVIFGSSNSAVWHPWKTPHAVVETDWDCKPCPGDRCYAFDEPRCILSVEPGAVVEAIERLLAEMPHNQEDGPQSGPRLHREATYRNTE